MNYKSLIVMALLGATVGTGCYAHSDSFKADVTSRLKSAEPALRSCYESALVRNRDAQGDVWVSLQTLPNSGKFSKVKVVDSSIKDPEFEGCVAQTISTLKLKESNLQTLELKYPLKFVGVD